jgi:hypothetical protein
MRIKHSMALNDKVLRGNLVLSIHPMDFVTMSDNNSDWSSCMSWIRDGCYHLGTVEMMNSNNVICCYLESKDNWCFYNAEEAEKKKENMPEPQDKSEWSWNNKKWRCLLYATKDIIVAGKSYPYYSEQLSKQCIEMAQKLAKDNLNWEYQYGIEEYRDMKNISSVQGMDNAAFYSHKYQSVHGRSKKHNIIFDTNAMYNDMFNDHTFTYWCVRNRVKRTKKISISGKETCLCCSYPVAIDNEEYMYDYYNERYLNVGHLICDECYNEGLCGTCDSFVGRSHIRRIVVNGISEYACDECIKDYYYICPCCGELHGRRSNSDYLLLMEEPPKNWIEAQAIYKYLNRLDYCERTGSEEVGEPYSFIDNYGMSLSLDEYKSLNNQIKEAYSKTVDGMVPISILKVCSNCTDKMIENGEAIKKIYTVQEVLNHDLRTSCFNRKLYLIANTAQTEFKKNKYMKYIDYIIPNPEDYPLLDD